MAHSGKPAFDFELSNMGVTFRSSGPVILSLILAETILEIMSVDEELVDVVIKLDKSSNLISSQANGTSNIAAQARMAFSAQDGDQQHSEGLAGKTNMAKAKKKEKKVGLS